MEASELNKIIREIESLKPNELPGILIHENGWAVEFNNSFVKMFGYTREELFNKDLTRLLIPAKYQGVIAEYVRRDYSEPYKVEGIKKDYTLFPLLIEAFTIHTIEKKKYRIAIFRNLTDNNATSKQLSFKGKRRETLNARLTQ